MMEMLIHVLGVIIVLQYPAALLVWLDARRLNVEHPERWRLAIVFLVVGWIAVFAYVHQRDDLARADGEKSRKEGNLE